MHKEVLTEKQLDLLPLIESFSDKFGLVGGTAIALHIGHRRSIDFDLFTNQEIDSMRIRNKITEAAEINQVVRDQQDQYTVVVDGVQITFMHYPYQIDFTENFESIKLPDLLTLAAMKAQALGRRAKWKDYVDLYFVMKEYHNLEKLVQKAEQIFGPEFSEKLFRSQLSYFKDIDYSEEVNYLQGFKTSDKQIKQWLKQVSVKENNK